MASPLNIFRKYQKQLMAALLLVAMFTFVVGGVIDQYLNRQSNSPTVDKVAVTWKGGKLTEQGVYGLRTNHHLLMNFLDEVAKKAEASGGEPKATPIPRANSEEDLVYRLIKARKAEQMGLVVNEDSMITYLLLLSDNTVRQTQLNAVMNDATGGRLDERTMFMTLRNELLAQKLEALAIGDWQQEFRKVQSADQPFAVPPTVAWDYFGRMHRRVRAEMYPLKVEDFMAKVKDEPTEAQIQKLYEEHQDDFPVPGQPEPGFKRYNQVAFGYVRLDEGKFLAEEKAKVTEEQIKEYYEKNKDTSYVEVELPELPGDKKDDKAPEDKVPDDKVPDDKVPEDKVPEDKQPGDAKPEDKKPDDAKPEDKKPEDAKPDDAKPEEKKPEDKVPDNKKPDDKKPAEKAVEESEKAPPEGCQDEPEKPEPKDPAPEKPQPKKEGEPDEKPKQDDPKPDESQPDATKKEPADEPQDDPKKPAKPPKKEVKYRPLNDKLKDDIRRLIAAPLAQTRLQQAAKEVQEQIREYGRELRRWEAVNKLETAEKDPKPEPFDLKKLARSLGLAFGEIPLIDPLAMIEDAKRDKPKYEISRTQAGSQFSMRTFEFAQVAFGAGAPLYEANSTELPLRLADEGRVTFLFWRTEEKPAYVPSLKDAREDVIKAWKRSAALKIAQDEAQKLADNVQKEGKSLKESLPADRASQAFETDSFSWLSRNTPMGMGGLPGISRIRKAVALEDDNAVDTPGDEFMEAVFSLQAGECGVAVNQPQTEVYVVRIIDEPISEDLLLQMFLDSPNKNDIYMLAMLDRRKQLTDWEASLEKEMSVKWQRDPDDRG